MQVDSTSLLHVLHTAMTHDEEGNDSNDVGGRGVRSCVKEHRTNLVLLLVPHHSHQMTSFEVLWRWSEGVER